MPQIESSNLDDVSLMKAITIGKLVIMLIRLIFAICLAGALAGCRQAPEPRKEPESPNLTRYELSIPKQFETQSFSNPYANWKKSLIKNLGYSESEIITRDFLVTDLILTVDGAPSDQKVYVSRKTPKLYLVPEIHLLISFDEEIVGTMGVAGTSNHLTNDKNFAVLIHPSGSQDFFGVLLGDLKTESPKPEFQKKQFVTFLR